MPCSVVNPKVRHPQNRRFYGISTIPSHDRFFHGIALPRHVPMIHPFSTNHPLLLVIPLMINHWLTMNSMKICDNTNGSCLFAGKNGGQGGSPTLCWGSPPSRLTRRPGETRVWAAVGVTMVSWSNGSEWKNSMLIGFKKMENDHLWMVYPWRSCGNAVENIFFQLLMWNPHWPRKPR